MPNRGIAEFTLDTGKCPPWLFERMKRLGKVVAELIILREGKEGFLKKIADPVWFQALGSVSGFDWNASGLTTTLTAALKEGLKEDFKDLGIFICGGKGRTSLKTPQEILSWGEKGVLTQSLAKKLVLASKLSAKVDSSLVQDGYQIYHHTFFFTKEGKWVVVQQGMNVQTQRARRYHWLSDNLKSFTLEPHFGILAQALENKVLDLTSKQSLECQKVSLDLLSGSYQSLLKDLKILAFKGSKLHQYLRFQTSLFEEFKALKLKDVEFKYHPVLEENFYQSKYLKKILYLLTQKKPKSFTQLLLVKGVGPKTVRALALVSELIYGAKPSFEDPARYSFAVGGKDGTPYPVDRETYDELLDYLEKAARIAKLSQREERDLLRRSKSLI